ncbi:zinc finger protein 235 [Aplysia californica]|uniref:Zinc finger protein 235 n=1 Tax=Aplysia californica TaxID=6500 RepID=A0ABM0K7A5_APLCA|nr:zinc finger protein 235 [Aplysia californica]
MAMQIKPDSDGSDCETEIHNRSRDQCKPVTLSCDSVKKKQMTKNFTPSMDPHNENEFPSRSTDIAETQRDTSDDCKDVLGIGDSEHVSHHAVEQSDKKTLKIGISDKLRLLKADQPSINLTAKSSRKRKSSFPVKLSRMCPINCSLGDDQMSETNYLVSPNMNSGVGAEDVSGGSERPEYNGQLDKVDDGQLDKVDDGQLDKVHEGVFSGCDSSHTSSLPEPLDEGHGHSASCPSDNCTESWGSTSQETSRERHTGQDMTDLPDGCSSLNDETALEKKSFKCKFCGVRFARRNNLQIHERSHTGEKPFTCEFCGEEFTGNGRLRRHLRVHTGEKPYQCEVCNARFAGSTDLENHKKIHSGETPYKCEVCGAQFALSGNLKIHKRLHTGAEEKPYKCDVCGAGFVGSGHLHRHKRKHTGEKPYKCDICSAAFAQNGSLQMHKRVHTGEKPFECEICGAKFTQSGNLLRHKKCRHAQENP